MGPTGALASTLFLALLVASGWSTVCSSQEAGSDVNFVPRAVIYPGDVISDDVLVEQPRDASRPSRIAAAKREDIVGKVARRTLLRGEIIPASALREKDVVLQGRTYALIYKSASLTVLGNGVPLQSAAANQIINVRNPDTGIVVKARVQADETLLVDVQ